MFTITVKKMKREKRDFSKNVGVLSAIYIIYAYQNRERNWFEGKAGFLEKNKESQSFEIR